MSNSVPEGWVESSLGNIADIRFSNVDKKSDFENEEPVKLCNYMDVYSNSKITNSLPFMQATAKDREIKKFSLLKNDVIITKDSETPDDIAVSAYVSEDLKSVVCGYHLAMLRPEQSLISGEYLNHLFGLDDIQHYFYLLANGITRFGLTTDAINNAYIIYPPLPEQKKIAAILTSVDTVIEKTQAQINKLKDLKTSMMQELLTKGIGHTEFKDSPVGRIPVEWEVKIIGSLGSVITGSTPKTSNADNYNGSIPFISPADICTGQSMHIEVTKSTISEEGLTNTRELPANSICVVCIGSTIGKAAITISRCATNQQINSIVCKNSYPEYVYYLMMYYAKSIKSEASTQAVPIINKSAFSALLVQVPPLSEQIKIGKIIKTIDDSLMTKQDKLSSLRNIKKALMQDLLTGKVRVKV